MTQGARARGDVAIAETEVAIVGGGFAGSALAAALTNRGVAVTVVDTHPIFPRQFRAEKLGPRQIALLRDLGLADATLVDAVPTKIMINQWNGRIIDHREVSEAGLYYHELIGALRRQVTDLGAWRFGRVESMELSADRQVVTLADGERIGAKLVVVATGTSDRLRRTLGVERRVLQFNQCLAVGLTLESASLPRHTAITCYGVNPDDGLDYVSIFPIGDHFRANAFIYADPDVAVTAALKADALGFLAKIAPGLASVLSRCAMRGRPDLHFIDLYECTNLPVEGAVLIGDAFRTSCPSVGTGITCALTDVRLLTGQIANWLAGAHPASRENIASFYASPEKLAQDWDAHRQAHRRRRAVRGESRLARFERISRFRARLVRDRLSRVGNSRPGVIAVGEA